MLRSQEHTNHSVQPVPNTVQETMYAETRRKYPVSSELLQSNDITMELITSTVTALFKELEEMKDKILARARQVQV